VISDAASAPPTGAEIVGASFHDTATVSGGQGDATGTVTYTFYGNGTCSGPPTTTEPVALTGGAVPSSPSTGPLGADDYSYQAAYGGDSTYEGSTGACEPFAVRKVAVGIATAVANDTTGQTPTGTERAGTSFHDFAAVAGLGGFTVTGSITYSFFGNGNCTAPASWTQVVSLSAGASPASRSTGPLAAGSYSFQAAYGGDGNYTAGTSPCEPFTVAAKPTVVHCVVPNVVGEALGAAEQVVVRHDCTAGRITHATSRAKKGVVIAQSPKPGTRLPRNARVNLTVSSGRRRRKR
jgi:hypothetical protein